MGDRPVCRHGERRDDERAHADQPGVIAIFGPSGVGKTAVAAALAELLRTRGEDAVAISADALQVYEGLETLTGAADAAESQLEHRLVGFVPITRTYSVGEFMPHAHAEIDTALAQRRRPIVLGGTGLYLRAALCELDLRPPPSDELRERLEREAAARGPAALHARLERLAPASAARVEPTDRARVIRALESLEGESAPDGPERHESQLWADEVRVPTTLAGLVMDRDVLYERIDARVDAIVAAGGEEEVRRAEKAGASRTARKALGYEELLRGDPNTMKRRTRNYAKRQLTWMRKLAGVRKLDVTGRHPSDVAEEITELTG